MSERRHFIAFRVIFGVYLCWYLQSISAHLSSLYGRDGIFSSPPSIPFPRAWQLFQSETALQCFHASLIIAGIFLIVGFYRRFSSFLLWYGLTCYLTYNPTLAPPHTGFVGWVILMLALIPNGEGGGFDTRVESWKIPSWCITASWMVLGVSYTCSGIDKLRSEEWFQGKALSIIYESPLARPNILSHAISSLPRWVLSLASISALLLEGGFAFALFHKTTRTAVYWGMTLLHLMCLATLSITSVSLGMLSYHLFLLPTLNHPLCWGALRARSASKSDSSHPF